MIDGILEEICRARGTADVRPEVFKKWQQYLRNEIDPKLERVADLEAENAQLKDLLSEATDPSAKEPTMKKSKKETAA